jgi:hypothetical protein
MSWEVLMGFSMEKNNGFVLENDGKNIVFEKWRSYCDQFARFHDMCMEKHQAKWGIPS